MTAVPNPTLDIYRNMNNLREARGWSREELAQKLTDAGRSTSYSAIVAQENGRIREASAHQLLLLAEVFEVSPAYLIQAKPPCEKCDGTPPAGYKCLTCGVSGTAPDGTGAE